jgi:hypothetical protein
MTDLTKLDFESSRWLEWDSSETWDRSRRQCFDQRLDDYLDDQNELCLGLDEHHELLALLKAAQASGTVTTWDTWFEKEHPAWFKRLMTDCERSSLLEMYCQDEHDNLMEALTGVIEDMGITEWLVQGRQMGWMKRSGYKQFSAKTGPELLKAVLPKTDCTFKIYIHDRHLTMRVSHHDAPTGESYWLAAQPEENHGDEHQAESSTESVVVAG